MKILVCLINENTDKGWVVEVPLHGAGQTLLVIDNVEMVIPASPEFLSFLVLKHQGLNLTANPCHNSCFLRIRQCLDAPSAICNDIMYHALVIISDLPTNT
jgi:hypothetical protein